MVRNQAWTGAAPEAGGVLRVAVEVPSLNRPSHHASPGEMKCDE